MKLIENTLWIISIVVAVTLSFLWDAYLSLSGRDKVSEARKRLK